MPAGTSSFASARALAGVAAAALGWACDSAPPPAEPSGPRPHPDVFVIVLDAASSFYFGTYGDVHGTSPNLDRFADDSVVFDQAYSQSATTTPSTASLLTGVRVMTHRTSGKTVLPEQFETVAELFGEHGYTSIAFISNPHAGAPELGLDRGYDEAVMLYAADALHPDRKIEKSSRFGVVLPEDIDEAIGEALPGFHGSATYGYFHYLQPHKPYDAPTRYLDAIADDSEACLCDDTPCRCGDRDWDTLHEVFLQANETGVASQSVVDHIKARYRANIRYVDESVGRLLDALRAQDLYDEALIVVLSDHGDAFFGHQNFGHNQTLYDDMVRIPLLMKFPATAGVEPRRLSALVETVDVVPTIFDFLGFALSPQWEGESLWPLIAGDEAEPGPAHREVVLATNRLDRQAIRVEDFKYIVSHEGREELYNLRTDPGEREDLAEREPERTRALRERLASVVGNSSAPAPRASDLRRDPEMDAFLEALGYVRGEDEPDEPRSAQDSRNDPP